jgi:GT2 family glycosyltransferase
MNVSVVMVYYDRLNQFKNTLDSYARFSTNKDVDIVIIEEHKNAADKKLHEEFIEATKDFRNIRVYPDVFKGSYNPGPKLNMAVNYAKYPTVLITVPEVMHCGDVFFDAVRQLTQNPMQWISYACKSEEDSSGWYQHSIFNSRALHYCAATTKECWKEIGGFDERYIYSLSWEDNDLIRTIYSKAISIKMVDNPFTVHQTHTRCWGLTPEEIQEKIRISQELFKKKWGCDRLLYLSQLDRTA